MIEQFTFEEKQYLGRDMTWMSVRLILALFCFVAYYLNLDHFISSQLFFIAGAGILFVSIIMLYMISYRTRVQDKKLILSGLWTTSLVKIDLQGINDVQVKPYSTFMFNNPVYNLHKNGKIRFYSGGKFAVWLTDSDGLVYVIGTQRPNELAKAIESVKSTRI